MAIPLVNVPQPQVVTPTPDYSGVTKGLMLYAQGRKQAQDLELANQKLTQDMALAQEKFGIDRQQLAQDYAYKNAMLKETAATSAENREYHQNVLNQQRDFHADEVKYKTDALKSLDEYRKEEIKYKSTWGKANNDWQIAILKNDKDAVDRLGEYGLNDPQRMAKDPLGYAADARRWMDEFQNSPAQSSAHGMIASMKDRLAPLNIKLPVAVGYEDQKVGKDPDTGDIIYAKKLVPKGGLRDVSVLDVIQKLDDPNTAEEMSNYLEAGGLLGPRKVGTKKIDTTFGGGTSGEATTTESELTGPIRDYIQEYLKGGKKIDFSRGESRVPTLMTPGPGAYKGTGQARQQAEDETLQSLDTSGATPASSATPMNFAPTQQEQIMQYARLALANGAPPEAVAERLAKNYGINFNDMTGPSTVGAPSDQFRLAVQAA